jgi:amino acid permease
MSKDNISRSDTVSTEYLLQVESDKMKEEGIVQG